MRAVILIFLSLFATARADVLNLANGDRYLGAIQLVNEKEVTLNSETLGVIKIPRAKVASIYFGTNQPPATAAHVSAARTEPAAPAAEAKFDEKTLDKVRQDFLATATPEANAMFTDLVQGLSSGRLSVDDIRKQARDALKELRELQAEIGDEDDNPLLAGYVGILEKFINAGGTNKAEANPKSAPKRIVPAEDE